MVHKRLKQLSELLHKLVIKRRIANQLGRKDLTAPLGALHVNGIAGALFGKQLDRDAYQPLWSTIRTALEQKHTFDGVYMDKYGNVDVLQSARRAVPKSASNR